jgi:hypothetical protein
MVYLYVQILLLLIIIGTDLALWRTDTHRNE